MRFISCRNFWDVKLKIRNCWQFSLIMNGQWVIVSKNGQNILMDFLRALQPERCVDNFSTQNGTIVFYSLAKAAILRVKAKQVLDYGAGRGSFWDKANDPNGSFLQTHLQDLRNTGARITACDIDPAVKTHPCSTSQVLVRPAEPLPFPDNTFDVIISDWTFEHLENPKHDASELLRILKPGGWICARTTNNVGYLRFAATIVPNFLHAAALKYVQPGRKEIDVFPTYYRLNSARAMKQYFGCAQVNVTEFWGDPAYFFGNRWVYQMFRVMHSLGPRWMAPCIFAFIRKPD